MGIPESTPLQFMSTFKHEDDRQQPVASAASQLTL
jgi:hypothetical protein